MGVAVVGAPPRFLAARRRPRLLVLRLSVAGLEVRVFAPRVAVLLRQSPQHLPEADSMRWQDAGLPQRTRATMHGSASRADTQSTGAAAAPEPSTLTFAEAELLSVTKLASWCV